MSLLAFRMFTAFWCLLRKTDENSSFLIYLNKTAAAIQSHYSCWSKCQHNRLCTSVLGLKRNRCILIINKKENTCCTWKDKKIKHESS
jgi:hypothetical protein